MLEREMAWFVQRILLIAGDLGGRVGVRGGNVGRARSLGMGRENGHKKKHA